MALGLAGAAITQQGQRSVGLPGHAVASGRPGLTFVVAGSAAMIDETTCVCTDLLGPGDIAGAQQAVRAVGRASPVWLTRGLALEASLSLLETHLSATELMKLALTAAVRRQRGLELAVVCNATHDATARLAGLIARICDDARSTTIPVTQAQLARMMGLQRTSITASAARLQALGAMKTRRGHILVQDLTTLRTVACGCLSPSPYEDAL